MGWAGVLPQHVAGCHDRESSTSLDRTLSNNRLELLTLTRLVGLEGIGSPVMKLAC